MKLNLLLIAMLLSSGCATTVSSVDAVCSEPFPTFTEGELQGLSDETLKGLDSYFERIKRGCN